MNTESKEELLKICNLVSEDIENDIVNMEGMPFNGKIVATYLGYQAAR